MFSTKMNDNLTGVGNFNSDWIEKQLGHSKVDVRATYNRDYDYKYLKERSVMMQKWSDFLDKCETGGTILNFAKRLDDRFFPIAFFPIFMGKGNLPRFK